MKQEPFYKTKPSTKKKYRRWLDVAIYLAEEDGLFIGAAFSQIAWEEQKKEMLEKSQKGKP